MWNIPTYLPKHFYSHDHVMQTALLFIMSTQCEYQTKILNTTWNNFSGFTWESLICFVSWIFFNATTFMQNCGWYYYLICWKWWKVSYRKFGKIFLMLFSQWNLLASFLKFWKKTSFILSMKLFLCSGQKVCKPFWYLLTFDFYFNPW